MTKRPTQYKDEALEILKNGKWSDAIVVTLIMLGISVGISFVPFIGSIVGILIGGPLAYGFSVYFLNLSRGEHTEIGQIFDGFKRFVDCLLAYIVMMIVIVIGFILLIVPGIIAALALSQTFRIMKDDPTIKPVDALMKSHEMMKGHRMDYFILMLSFIGWALLCILTAGLGFLVLMPYATTALTLFYNDLAGHQSAEITELASHLDPKY